MIKKLKAVRHYSRIIKKARSYPPEEFPTPRKLFDDIGEDWSSEFCSYCQAINNVVFVDCEECELNAKGEDGKFSCCGGLWEEMDRADTWKEWIECAEKVKNFIKENG